MHTLSLKRLLPWRRCPIAYPGDANFNRAEFESTIHVTRSCKHDTFLTCASTTSTSLGKWERPSCIVKSSTAPLLCASRFPSRFALLMKPSLLEEKSPILGEKRTRLSRHSSPALFTFPAIYSRELEFRHSRSFWLTSVTFFLINMRSFIPRNARVIYGKASEYSA